MTSRPRGNTIKDRLSFFESKIDDDKKPKSSSDFKYKKIKPKKSSFDFKKLQQNTNIIKTYKYDSGLMKPKQFELLKKKYLKIFDKKSNIFVYEPMTEEKENISQKLNDKSVLEIDKNINIKNNNEINAIGSISNDIFKEYGYKSIAIPITDDPILDITLGLLIYIV